MSEPELHVRAPDPACAVSRSKKSRNDESRPDGERTVTRTLGKRKTRSQTWKSDDDGSPFDESIYRFARLASGSGSDDEIVVSDLDTERENALPTGKGLAGISSTLFCGWREIFQKELAMAARQLLSDDGKSRCMFETMRTILEERLGWIMSYSDKEPKSDFGFWNSGDPLKFIAVRDLVRPRRDVAYLRGTVPDHELGLHDRLSGQPPELSPECERHKRADGSFDLLHETYSLAPTVIMATSPTVYSVIPKPATAPSSNPQASQLPRQA
ncbi:hypothetical protein ON010_g16556 [Phytophthora cinnamomi]|nr:hypothetical protein ON010_g16556 [Phytophthora cinnamomi]